MSTTMIQTPLLLGALCLSALGLSACEVKNPIAAPQAAPAAQAVAAKTPEQLRDNLLKNFEQQVKDADKIKEHAEKQPVKFQELDPKAREEAIKRLALPTMQIARKDDSQGAAAAPPAPSAEATTPLPGLTTSTKIKPDGPKTADKAPTAKDLKRYTKDLPGKGKLKATIRTSQGDFKCELFEDAAPMTVANFVGLARGLKAWIDPGTKERIVGQAFYNDVAFHRVIPNFMIQTGDRLSIGMDKPDFKPSSPMNAPGTGNPGYKFADETKPNALHDKPGILSMANSGPGTNGSQFFITEVPTPHLNGRHTVFGACEPEALVKVIAKAGNGKTVIRAISFYREP